MIDVQFLPAGLVAAALGLWILVTIAYAFPLGKKLLNRPGVPVQLIPMWNFFAPNPGVYDYFLLYRDRHSGDFVAPWKESPHFTTRRPWFAFAWNPKKIEKKLLFDLVSELLREANHLKLHDTEIERLQLSLPYLFLLQYITTFPRAHHCNATQFMVMRRSVESDSIEPVFISHLHNL